MAGIVEIMNIIAGLVLAMGILPSIPAIGNSLEKVAKWLGCSRQLSALSQSLWAFFSLVGYKGQLPSSLD